MEYRDFEVHIHAKANGAYHVKAHAEGVAGHWEFQTRDSWFKEIKTQKQLKKIGGQLFNAIFGGQVRDAFQQTWGWVRSNGNRGLRMQLVLSLAGVPDRRIATLPWEFLYYDPNSSFLALIPQISLVRRIEVPETAVPIQRPKRLGLLMVFCNALSDQPLQGHREVRLIEKALKGSDVDIHFMENATLDDLSAELGKGNFHFFHFIGHGRFIERSGKGMLFFGGPDSMQAVEGDHLARVLRSEPSLRVAYLNACESGRTGAAEGNDPHTATTAALLKRGIPSVIGMSSKVGDEQAIQFASTFYHSLVKGEALDEAVGHARGRVSATATNHAEWGYPVLFMQTEHLFLDSHHHEVKTTGAIPVFTEEMVRKEAEVRASDAIADMEPPLQQAKPKGKPLGAIALAAIVIISALSWLGWQQGSAQPLRLVVEAIEGQPGVENENPMMGQSRQWLMEVFGKLKGNQPMVVTDGVPSPQPQISPSRVPVFRVRGRFTGDVSSPLKLMVFDGEDTLLTEIAPKSENTGKGQEITKTLLQAAVQVMKYLELDCDSLALQNLTDHADQLYRAAEENGKGLDLLNAGLVNEARSRFAGAVGIWPAYTPAQVNLAVLDARAGDYTAAVARMERVLELGSDLVVYHYNLGFMARRAQQTAKAVAAFQAALKVDPQHRDARNELALIYLDQGLPEEAETLLEEGLRLHPAHAVYYKNLGMARVAMGQWERALKPLDQAARRLGKDHVPGLVLVYKSRAQALVALGRFQKACRDLRLARELDPDYLFLSLQGLTDLIDRAGCDPAGY